MNKKRVLSICIAGIYFVLLILLNIDTFQFDNTMSTNIPSAEILTEVIATIEGKEQKVSLPNSFQTLSPRTPVTITSKLKAKQEDCLYIKSVYAPLKVYANDNLIYEYGQENTYPKFMQDPATAVKIVQLPNTQQNINLKMEYLSPIARDVLTVHPVLVGSETAIMKNLFNTMGFSFIFSIIQIFIGVFLILIAVFVVSFERKGIAFFWLGLFSIATGGWTFGECNLTGLFFHNYTALYLLAFLGLFSFPIPLIYFGLSVVNFHSKKPIVIYALFLSCTCCITMFLQLLGIVSLSKSMYLFHILVPLSLCFFAVFILHESIKYKNKAAIRLFFPVVTLPIFAILEVINYQLRFTNVLSFFFQMGIIFFIFMTSMIGGIFIRDSLVLKEEKQRLEYEVSLMEKQVEAQKKHHNLLLENEEKIKVQRHDLRHQLAVIRSLSENENNSRLTSYLDTLITEIPSEYGTIYCKNIAVNAIVSHYAALAEKYSIELTIKMNIPEHTEQISDSNLCVILGNLFENAIEACNRMTDGHKFIRLHSRLQYETLTITMDNSFDGKFIENDGKFVSRKREDIGTGLTSVTAVAEKHGGGSRFEVDGLVFLSSVYVRV
ncbi:sensor histidine kinase [Inediibacterium massiliense]|uniref:sensor histidine kinase n=1 Tax=Inediibacterium massiliense TaxID=1658111 RepID=UPI0006B6122E|nr:GHKL domain-containing protein [Inediibacterium massiliense]